MQHRSRRTGAAVLVAVTSLGVGAAPAPAAAEPVAGFVSVYGAGPTSRVAVGATTTHRYEVGASASAGPVRLTLEAAPGSEVVATATSTDARLTCSTPTACTLQPSQESSQDWYAPVTVTVRALSAGTLGTTLRAAPTATVDDPDPADDSASVRGPEAVEPLAATLDAAITVADEFVVVTGTLRAVRDGRALLGVPVELAHRPRGGGAWTSAASDLTDGSGAFELRDAAPGDLEYVARVPEGAATSDDEPVAPVESATLQVDRVATDLRVAGPTRVTAGQPVTVSLVVTRSGQPARSVDVTVERRLSRESAPSARLQATTDGTGAARITDRPVRNATYTVHVPAGPGAAAARATLAVVVVPASAQSVSPVLVPPGGRATVTVRVPAARAGQRLVLQEYVGGAWRGAAALTLDRRLQASWSTARAAVGTYRFRAVGAATADHGPLTTPVVALAVRPHSGGDARSYRFLGTGRDGPHRWEPCRAIPYTVNLSAAPPGALADVQEAVRRLRQSSGLDLRYAGTTGFVPATSRLYQQPTPLVIAWSRVDPYTARRPWSQDGTLGVAPSSAQSSGGDRYRFVRAAVVLNAAYGSTLRTGFGAGTTWGGVLLHELAHAVGLDHVDDPRMLLYPSALDLRAAMFGAGDVAGLRAVGRTRAC